MATSEVLERELKEQEQALAVVKAQAATAEPDQLGPVGSLVAGIGAKVESLRARLADALRSEQQARDLEQQRAQEAERATAVAAFEAHRKQHADRWAALVSVMTDCEKTMTVAWAEFDALNLDARELAKQAGGLGLSAGTPREGGEELFRRMQKGGSPLRHMPMLRAGVR